MDDRGELHHAQHQCDVIHEYEYLHVSLSPRLHPPMPERKPCHQRIQHHEVTDCYNPPDNIVGLIILSHHDILYLFF